MLGCRVLSTKSLDHEKEGQKGGARGCEHVFLRSEAIETQNGKAGVQGARDIENPGGLSISVFRGE